MPANSTLRVLPYKAASLSARTIARALSVRRINVNNTAVRGIQGRILNWGNSDTGEGFSAAIHLPNVPEENYINPPALVRAATCKLRCFETLALAGVRVPYFTTSIETAREWLNEQAHPVVCRTLLRANSGRGIVLAESEDELVRSPLYTMYVPKQTEYRVHVCRGRVFDIQRKARKHDVPDDQVNWRIRNTANGFIFARGSVSPETVPDDVLHQARRAVLALDLDFGAVDIIWNNHRNHAYVLEVNTAPGLEGTTLENYVRMIRGLLDGTPPEDIGTPGQPSTFPEQGTPPAQNLSQETRDSEESEESQESEELSEEPVVQPTQDIGLQGTAQQGLPRELYCIMFANVVLHDKGLYRTLEEAQQVIDTDFVLSNTASASVQSIQVHGG